MLTLIYLFIVTWPDRPAFWHSLQLNVDAAVCDDESSSHGP